LPGVAILGDASEARPAEVADVGALKELLVRVDDDLLLAFALQDLDQSVALFLYRY